MNVELIGHTQDALDILLYTKDTRLQGANGFQDIKDMPMDEKLDHLAYMKDTIQSSWEFVDYTFKISGVTRAFTHQLVRTRTGSYAQESQRTVDVRGAEIIGPDSAYFQHASDVMMDMYELMISAENVPVQDARAILPTGITTSIIAKFDLRTLHNMGLLRLCTRTQGEYQEVFKAMLAEVVKVHPWADEFIRVACVWSGVCAFPRYSDCPIQEFTTYVSDDHKNMIEDKWRESNHVAIPVANNAMTMHLTCKDCEYLNTDNCPEKNTDPKHMSCDNYFDLPF